MAEILPTFAPTIAPTSHVRVEAINPEPLVIWDQRQFNDVSSEELLLEVASQQQQEQENATQHTPLRQGAPPLSTGTLDVPPPLEIVVKKSKSKDSLHGSTSMSSSRSSRSRPPSPRSPSRKPPLTYVAPRASPKLSSRRRSSSRSCDTTKRECDSLASSSNEESRSLPPLPLPPMITHPPPSMPPPSIDVAVPLALTTTSTTATKQPAAPAPMAVVAAPTLAPTACTTTTTTAPASVSTTTTPSQPSIQVQQQSSLVMGFLQDRISTFESNMGVLAASGRKVSVVEQGVPRGSPLGRFVEARVTTFLNNVEYLTGLQVSGKKPAEESNNTTTTTKAPPLLLQAGDTPNTKEGESSVALTEAAKIEQTRHPPPQSAEEPDKKEDKQEGQTK